MTKDNKKETKPAMSRMDTLLQKIDSALMAKRTLAKVKKAPKKAKKY